MTTTKNGLKATAVRGHSRVFLVEKPGRGRVEFIEIKSGVAIEEVDTDAIERSGEETFDAFIHARKLDRRDCEDRAQAGWYVSSAFTHCGPLPTKAEAIRQMRLILADVKIWCWRDIPKPAKATKAEAAQWLAREARARAREAHRRGAAGTKITRRFVEEVANQLICDGRLTEDDADPAAVRKAHRIAVETSYEYGDRHLVNLADVPGLRLTARDRIDLAAAEHGWSVEQIPAGWATSEKRRYSRGDDYISVKFSKSGHVTGLYNPLRNFDRTWTGKAESAIAYLTGKKA